MLQACKIFQRPGSVIRSVVASMITTASVEVTVGSQSVDDTRAVGWTGAAAAVGGTTVAWPTQGTA